MRDFIPSPSHIDQWLDVVTQRPGASPIQGDYVVCLVEKACIEALDRNLPTHVLYITAHRADGPPFLRQSPCTILGHYVGQPYERRAPRWIRWTKPSVSFTYRTAGFAKLFRHMALWNVNSDQPGLSLEMTVWARSVVGVGPFCPRTPPSNRVPQDPATRRFPLFYDPNESPITARQQADCVSFDTRDSELELDIDVGSSVAKVLDFGLPANKYLRKARDDESF